MKRIMSDFAESSPRVQSMSPVHESSPCFTLGLSIAMYACNLDVYSYV